MVSARSVSVTATSLLVHDLSAKHKTGETGRAQKVYLLVISQFAEQNPFHQLAKGDQSNKAKLPSTYPDEHTNPHLQDTYKKRCFRGT